jgi:GDPmannose 4,6-dehydratase
MAEYLLRETDYLIVGVMRRSATPNFVNIAAFKDNPRFHLMEGDLGDAVSINNIVSQVRPDYFINFAANSFVKSSWEVPEQVFDVNTLGVLRCLEAIRKFHPTCRFYSAGSSEEWGNVDYSPQDMKHPIKPRSPYGASKAAARHIVKVYRESYNLYAIHGILFNHEGTKRSEEFVTRKITTGVARIAKALKENAIPYPIELGNLDAKRDWSDSEDFVDGIWKMLNQEMPGELLNHVGPNGQLMRGVNQKCLDWKPREYILASGETHSIREFVELAFEAADIPGFWRGTGRDERYVCAWPVKSHNPVLVQINPKFYRPAEVDLLLGDSTPVRKELGWSPKTTFPQLVQKMVRHDLALVGLTQT